MSEVYIIRDDLKESIDGLHEEIIETGKNNIKYMGEACDYKLKSYEENNEKIRKERQIRYGENITQIHELMGEIRSVLDNIQKDIQENGKTLVKHETQIEELKKKA